MGDTNGFHQLPIEHRSHEREVVSTRIHIDIGPQTVYIGKIFNISGGFESKGCGQFQARPNDLHAPHIAAHHAIYLQRIVGEPLPEGLRHGLHETHNILLTYGCVDCGIHLARATGIESIQIHRELRRYTALRCAQNKRRKVQTQRVHRHRSGHLCYLQPALFVESTGTQAHRKLRTAIQERVYTERNAA